VRKLALAATTAALTLAALPSAASAADVCNEAENSHRGEYVITETPDPNPPAFLRGKQMRLGNGHGKGLARAADNSPALHTCGGPATDPVDPTDPGDGGGGGPVTEV
jgi:hypothetical protein